MGPVLVKNTLLNPRNLKKWRYFEWKRKKARDQVKENFKFVEEKEWLSVFCSLTYLSSVHVDESKNNINLAFLT